MSVSAGPDEGWMRLALALARRGEGRVSPNPLVGAVVVRGKRVVGRGWHRAFGRSHAEVEALDQAGSAARGATLYVTLEPCNHHGKTPPCVEAILAAGVARVVAAMPDPNRAVRGGGMGRLRRAGVAVRLGVLGPEAERINQSFVQHVRTGRPLVLWKCAQSLDGRIALPSGVSRWLSGEPARRWAHGLRRWADAILVGAGTVLADDPQLTARIGAAGGRQPRPVVMDSRLRTPPTARFLAAAQGNALVYCLEHAPARRRARLEGAGAEVVAVRPGVDGRPDPRRVLQDLGRRGVGRLLVEGGGELAAALLAMGLIDRVALILAPRLIGSDGRAALGPLGLAQLDDTPQIEVERRRVLGRDLLIEGRLDRRGTRG